MSDVPNLADLEKSHDILRRLMPILEQFDKACQDAKSLTPEQIETLAFDRALILTEARLHLKYGWLEKGGAS